MSHLLLVGFGGFLGSISRFGISQYVRSHFPHAFPLATFSVNVIGCLAIGVLFSYFRNHLEISQWMSFAAVGFLGAFTTFSAFGLENVELIRAGEMRLAVFNVLGSLIFCLAAVAIGQWAGSFLK